MSAAPSAISSVIGVGRSQQLQVQRRVVQDNASPYVCGNLRGGMGDVQDHW